MRSEAYIYSFTEPIDPEDLVILLRQTHWANKREAPDVQRMLNGSQITLGVWHEERLMAFSRVVTDDLYRAFIDDVIVDVEFRGQGIASTMLDKLLKRLQHVEQVMLDCDSEMASFYARFGFKHKGCSSMILENRP